MIGEELVAGDVITIEPGLYRHGFGGVRVEDLLLVTEDGYERLTDCPYDLELRSVTDHGDRDAAGRGAPVSTPGRLRRAGERDRRTSTTSRSRISGSGRVASA